MVNSIKNLFLLDYNDIIVLGMEKVGYSFLKNFIGENKFKELEVSNAKGNSKYEKYMNDDTLHYLTKMLKKIGKILKNHFILKKLNNATFQG